VTVDRRQGQQQPDQQQAAPVGATQGAITDQRAKRLSNRLRLARYLGSSNGIIEEEGQGD
jgi:hypothetical protein